MEYLGSLGRLVGLRCASTERVGAESRYSVRTTVEGRRRAQVVPSSPRAWDVSWGAGTNPDIAALSAFTTGGWGAGPWHWVSIQAQRLNLLTPREAVWLDSSADSAISVGGPMLGADGQWTPSSVLNSSATSSSTSWLFRRIPVIPGRPVTWALDVQSDGSGEPELAMVFIDMDDERIGGGFIGHVSSETGTHRAFMTQTPPDNAAEVMVGIKGATRRAARPQVTWGDGLASYSMGYGCRAAIIDGLSESLIFAARDSALSDVRFTVMEVS